MKKVLCLLLCACLLAGAFCCPVSAVEDGMSQQEQVIQQAESSYRRSLYSAGRSSFTGYCGLMVSHQLYNLKINTSCIVNDGNNQFDYYKDVEVTSGGYYPTPYSAGAYTLGNALNTVSRYGTKDVYNVLVGFQWTNTNAGSIYGHTVLINAILDGMCYFVESFGLNLDTYYPEGSVIVCSIAEFADYFNDWTGFEGIIHFGTGSYSDSCEVLGTDVTVQARFASQLRSQPCLVGQNDCIRIRTVEAGEQLRATGILTDKLGQQFYRIEESGMEAYIAAGAVCAQQEHGDELKLEESVSRSRDVLSGTVVAKNGCVTAVEVLVKDSNGVPVMQERMETLGYRCDIGCLNELLTFDLLEPGVYTMEIYADSALPVVEGGQIQLRYNRMLLCTKNVQLDRGNDLAFQG